jgi:hypothetical protein
MSNPNSPRRNRREQESFRQASEPFFFTRQAILFVVSMLFFITTVRGQCIGPGEIIVSLNTTHPSHETGSIRFEWTIRISRNV